MTAEIVRLMPSKSSEPPSKTVVVAEIRSRITTGRLALGAGISDKQLAAELDVSRTPGARSARAAPPNPKGSS